MNWLAEKFNTTLDTLLRSTFTMLVFLGLIGFVIWYFFRKSLSPSFWVGFGVAILALIVVRTTKVYPVNGDKVFDGTLQDYAERSAAGGIIAPIDKKKLQDWLNSQGNG